MKSLTLRVGLIYSQAQNSPCVMLSGFLLFLGWWCRRRYQVGKLNSLNVSYSQQATLQSFIVLTGALYTWRRGLRGESPSFFLIC